MTISLTMVITQTGTILTDTTQMVTIRMGITQMGIILMDITQTDITEKRLNWF